MKSVISTLAVATVLAIAAPVQADGTFGYGHRSVRPAYATVHPLEGLREINMRQARQRERIEVGFHRGVITRWEFRRLMAEQQDIQAMERAFISDGFLSPHERVELNRRLDMASAHIRFEASDFQRRF